MRIVKLAALAALMGLVCVASVACYDETKPLPPYYPDYPPAPPFGAALETACSDACKHLRELGCPEGSGSLGGEPCSFTCVRASSARALPLSCWADAGSTAEAKACGSLRCIR